MLLASPKKTVPILVNDTKQLIDESLDIMLWALEQNDPCNWLSTETQQTQLDLIEKNDTEFKPWLDRYKYFDRFPENTQDYYLEQCLVYLEELESALENYGCLIQQERCLADWAIFPFVRQFALSDKDRFEGLPLPKLQQWLNSLLQDNLFKSCMQKYEPWAEETSGIIF